MKKHVALVALVAHNHRINNAGDEVMNYEDVSDFKINQDVTCELFGCHEWSANQEGTFYHCGADGSGYFIQTVADYCNNPSDAMPILIENKIGFKWVNGGCTASSVLRGYHESTSDNPLRAAMIVFLMMQDDAKCQKP